MTVQVFRIHYNLICSLVNFQILLSLLNYLLQLILEPTYCYGYVLLNVIIIGVFGCKIIKLIYNPIQNFAILRQLSHLAL